MDYIVHYGIKGQHHGVRRFQNEDGSLTPAGKERYRKNSDGRYTDKYKDFLDTNVSLDINHYIDNLGSGGEDIQGMMNYTVGMYLAAYDDEYDAETANALVQYSLGCLAAGMNAVNKPKTDSAMKKKISSAASELKGVHDKVESKVGSVLSKFKKPKESVILSPHFRKPKNREVNTGKRTGEIKVRKPTKEERKAMGKIPAAYG